MARPEPGLTAAPRNPKVARTPEGVCFEIHVTPRAHRAHVGGLRGTALRVVGTALPSQARPDEQAARDRALAGEPPRTRKEFEMPIYDYGCQKCGHEFEKEQRIVDDPIKTCPACGANKAKRLISKTSFVLKGGGWYNDLYSSTGASAKSDGGSDDDAGASSGKDKSSDKAKDASDSGEKKPKSKSKKKSAA